MMPTTPVPGWTACPHEHDACQPRRTRRASGRSRPGASSTAATTCRTPAYGEKAYAKGHIPGALFLHLDRDLSGEKTGSNGRHPLPGKEAFAATMAACGVGPDTQVVAYDNEGSIFASRLWWMLRWVGHEKVAVLDGGVPGWRRAKREFQIEVPIAIRRQPSSSRPGVDALHRRRRAGAAR